MHPLFDDRKPFGGLGQRHCIEVPPLSVDFQVYKCNLLGVELNNLRSVPVGYMEIKDMYPLDLEEFMWAVGVNKDVIGALKTAWGNNEPLDDFVHRKMMDVFRLYLIVGGMPDVVNAYKENNNLQDVVAQELLAHGFSELYYYNSKKMGEVDFVVEHNGEVFPIEVKSGKDYARHRALNNILDCKEYNIPKSVVLCNDNYAQKDKVTYVPIYMVMFIYKDPDIDVKFSLDLSGL